MDTTQGVPASDGGSDDGHVDSKSTSTSNSVRSSIALLHRALERDSTRTESRLVVLKRVLFAVSLSVVIIALAVYGAGTANVKYAAVADTVQNKQSDQAAIIRVRSERVSE